MKTRRVVSEDDFVVVVGELEAKFSRVVDEISSITSVTRATEAITSCMVAPALLARVLPVVPVLVTTTPSVSGSP